MYSFANRPSRQLLLTWLFFFFLLASFPARVFGLAFDWNGDLRWTGGVVPYVLDSNLTTGNRVMVEKAMLTWQRAANICFVKRTTQTDYVKISYTPLHDVNFSYVARSGGEQPCWINDWTQRIVTHELGHALGLCHEHQRSDRDNYVTIGGYIPGTDVNYFKLDGTGLSLGAVSDNRTPYDYYSIMHYDAKGFNLPWVSHVIVPNYLTIADDPTGNPAKALLDGTNTLIDIIGIQWEDPNSFGIYSNYLSILDRQGIVSEYGASCTIESSINPDGLTVHVADYPTNILLKLTGTGKTVDAARRMPSNPIKTTTNVFWSFGGVPTGTYTLTPEKTGFLFTPSSQTIVLSNAGQKVQFAFKVSRYETNPPTVTISSAFKDGDAFKTGPLVFGDARDEGSGVAEVRIALFRDSDGVWYDFVGHTWGTGQFSFSRNYATADGTSFWLYQLPALTDGTYSVYAQAVDAQNNGSAQWDHRAFIVDNVPPVVTVFTPANNMPYSTAPAARGVASDANSDVAEVRVAIADNATGKWWNWSGNGWGTTTFDFVANVRKADDVPNWHAALPSLPPGGYQLAVQSVDTANNGSSWEYSQFYIDQTPPIVSFNGLTNQQHIFDFSSFAGSISKTGWVTFKITEYNIGGSDRYWNGYAWLDNNNGVDLLTDMNGTNWFPAPYDPLPTRAQTRPGFYLLDVTGNDIAGNSYPTNLVLYRTLQDTNPPDLVVSSPLNNQVFTNNAITGGIGGTALDPESGVAGVDVYLFRRDSSGNFLYWNGNSWTSSATNLPAAYDAASGHWQVPVTSGPLAYALPSGGNLPNTNYTLQVSAHNKETPQGTRSISVNFSVDYHPVFNWTAGSNFDSDPNNNDYNWNNPANWSAGAVPPPEAIVNVLDGAPDAISMGSMSLYALNVSNSTIRTVGIQVKKKFTLLSGTINNSGNLNLLSGGSFDWSGGSLTGTLLIPTNSTLNLTNASDKYLAGLVITNHGTIIWTGNGKLMALYGSAIHNFGLFEARNDSQFYNYSGNVPQPLLRNVGTFRKTAGTNATSFPYDNTGWVFSNTGLVDVQVGTLSILSQAILQEGGTFSGSGITRFESGTATLAGTNHFSGSGTVELTGGTMDGTGAFDGPGTFIWSGGTFTGTNVVGPSASLLISGTSSKTLAGLFHNQGTAVWVGSGDVNCRYGSTFINSGSFTAQNDAQFYNYTGNTPLPQFINFGSFIKATGTNTTSFANPNSGMAFNNFGSVQAQSGTILLAGGGTNSHGSFVAGPNGTIEFGGGLHTLVGGNSFSGSGRTRLTAGTLTLGGGTNQVLNGGTLEMAGGVSDGSGTFAGPGLIQWTGGSINGTLSLLQNANLTLSGAADKTLGGGTILNAGTILWTGAGRLFGRYGSVLNNTGTFIAQSDSEFYNYSGNNPLPTLNNSGVFIKTNSSNQTTFSIVNSGWVFNNSGVVDVQSGVLSLQSEAHILAGGTFSGVGLTRVDGGVATMAGASTIAAGGTFQLTGGILNGVGTFNGPGLFNWLGGTLNGTNGVGPSGNLLISGNGTKTLVGQFSSAGQATWTGSGTVNCAYRSAFNNLGTFTAASDAVFYNYTGNDPQPVFNNSGTFTKSGTAGLTDFSSANGGMAFNNTGTVNVQNGTLSLSGGGTHNNAIFITAVGTRAELASGSHAFNGAVTFSGAGQTRLTGGTLTLGGSAMTLSAGGTFEVGGGIVDGSGTFGGTGNLLWTGGNITGTVNLSSTANLLLSGNSPRTLRGTFNHAGSALWTGTGDFYFNYGAVFNNNGLFIAQNDAQFYNSSGNLPTPVFVNNGTLRKAGTTGVTAFSYANGGVNLINNGVLDIQSGQLAIQAGSFSAPASQTKLSLAGTTAMTQFGQETFMTSANLGGSLVVTLANGFMPTNGHTFALVTYPSRTGQFNSPQLPALPRNLLWQVDQGPTAVTLKVVQSTTVDGITKMANGHFKFNVNGPIGSSAIVQTSTNLVDWVPVLTNAPYTGTLQFDDAQAAHYTNRFYRIIVQP